MRNQQVHHLVWCDDCDCYTANFFTHCCDTKRRQRTELAALGPARSNRRRETARAYTAHAADAARARRAAT